MGRAEDDRRDRIIDARASELVEAPERDIGELSDLERAELVVAPEAARAVDRGAGKRLARRHRLRTGGQAGELQRGAHLGREPAVLV